MKNKKVLIVDDNALNRRVFEHIIGQVYEFESAENGSLALEKLKQKAFDLVLMDIQMPVMDGITTLKRIKADQVSSAPIIAISAYADQSDKDYFLSTGFSDFIAKPIKPKSFLETISYHLGAELVKEKERFEEFQKEVILDTKILAQLLKYNSEENIKIVYQDFIEETETLLNEIYKLILTGNHKEIGEKLHIIKGNSGTLGALLIYKYCKEFEKNIKNDIFDNTLKDYLFLREQLNKFKSFINTIQPFNA